jgi:hypothetical protein
MFTLTGALNVTVEFGNIITDRKVILSVTVNNSIIFDSEIQ